MPTKLNKAGKQQDYIPKGNGDASGEYGTSNGTNKNFTTSDKKTQANVITENKSVVVENKGKGYSELEKLDWGIKENNKQIATLEKSGKYPEMLKRLKEQNAIMEKQKEEIKNGKREKADLADDGKPREKEQILPFENDNEANIINDDLTGKKEENKESFEFNDRKGTNETKKMVEAMYELGIDPVKDWDKQQYKKAEQLADYFLEKGLGKPSEKMMKGRNGTQRDVLIGTFLDLQDGLRMKFTNKSFSKWFDETQAKYNK